MDYHLVLMMEMYFEIMMDKVLKLTLGTSDGSEVGLPLGADNVPDDGEVLGDDD